MIFRVRTRNKFNNLLCNVDSDDFFSNHIIFFYNFLRTLSMKQRPLTINGKGVIDLAPKANTRKPAFEFVFGSPIKKNTQFKHLLSDSESRTLNALIPTFTE